jgi:hypothetical protein
MTSAQLDKQQFVKLLYVAEMSAAWAWYSALKKRHRSAIVRTNAGNSENVVAHSKNDSTVNLYCLNSLYDMLLFFQ